MEKSQVNIPKSNLHNPRDLKQPKISDKINLVKTSEVEI